MTDISYDTANGKFTLSSAMDNSLYFSRVIELTCFTNILANSCVTVVGENAEIITSKYNNNIANLPIPIIYGISLTDAQIGQTAPFGNIVGSLYNTTDLLPGNYQDILYVGQDGRLTNIIPSLAAGDIWSIAVAVKIGDYQLIYNPQAAINLSSTPLPAPVPQVIGSNEKITLANAMPRLTCFSIDSTGKAYTVTSNDAIIPLIDGLTLESGGINQQISVARLKNYYYDTGNYFIDGSIYYLSASGIITNVRPTVDSYLVIVGRSLPNSTLFIFDPQMPIMLSQN